MLVNRGDLTYRVGHQDSHETGPANHRALPYSICVSFHDRIIAAGEFETWGHVMVVDLT